MIHCFTLQLYLWPSNFLVSECAHIAITVLEKKTAWSPALALLWLSYSEDRTLEMAIEDYVCSLFLSRCGHALLAKGNGLIASWCVKMLASSGLPERNEVLISHASYLKRTQYP